MTAKGEGTPFYTMGVDSGSLTGKAVILDGEKRIVSHSVKQLGFVSDKAVKLAIEEALEKAGLELEDISFTVSTGYGRKRLAIAGKNLTEISCHARGANYLSPEVKTVIDIGGQDSKVIAVDPVGNVKNFAMNDKCAAGTGQFLEVLARALDVELSEIGELSLKSDADIKISSMCTTFAESEVISLVADGNTTEDILSGMHRAISARMKGLVGRVGMQTPVMMTGGGAKNIGLVTALEKSLGVSIFIPDDPQIVGALGAAIFANDFATGLRKKVEEEENLDSARGPSKDCSTCIVQNIQLKIK
ncbi:acyl-CoA dehydratase activase [Bacillus sp. EB600]|uniref:acyl-CoA dehydratase activase n=1 Tax=Bacillus sp. EB600 TaxID=2806345 RepID=UPI00210933F3|nr:acyl-CoA dehydratase activase [Bacillus sp. EB600]MCQ6281674.1 2-hydroxyglutaryl-CoA dehydratase [Bacillus sp. EB600]